MVLYLFRHGESTDNRAHLFSGWRDVPLSEKGKIDCQEVAELLKGKEIDLFYSPDLKRNQDTVETIRQYHVGSSLTTDDRLRERKYGDLQGQSHLGLMKKDLDLYLSYHRAYDAPPPNGESIRMVEDRVKPLFEEVIARIGDEKVNVAICAGNNAMRVLRKYLENLTVEQMLKIENPFDNYFEYEVAA